MRSRVKSPLLLAALIVVLLSVGAAGAAKLITGKDIANHSITGQDIKKGSVPLSALKRTPTGTTGPRGPVGGEGLIGTTGPTGASVVSEIAPLHSAIAGSIAPGKDLVFLGEPAQIVVLDGDQGVIESTVTVGTTAATIDDPAKFAISVCFDQGAGPFVLDAGEGGEFGASPAIVSGQRQAVTVSTGFAAKGAPGETIDAEVGACVLNETASPLDDNGRAMGYAMVSSAVR